MKKAHIRTGFRRSLAVLVLCAISLIALPGCKREVDKQHMDAAVAWVGAVCACAKKPTAEARKCLVAVGDQPSYGQKPGEFPGNVFTPASLEAFDQITLQAQDCRAKILNN